MKGVLNRETIPLAEKALLLPFLALLMATFILAFAAILTRLTEFEIGAGAIVHIRIRTISLKMCVSISENCVAKPGLRWR